MKPAPSQGPERSPGSVRPIMQNDDDPAVQAVGAKGLSAEHEKFADFLHGAIMQNINLADRKAGIIFTLVSAATLFLFRQAPDMIVGLQAGPSVRGVLWWLIVVLLIGAAVSAFFVIFPRIRRRGTPQRSKAARASSSPEGSTPDPAPSPRGIPPRPCPARSQRPLEPPAPAPALRRTVRGRKPPRA